MHPVIRAYQFARTQQQQNPVDACRDTAEYYGIPAPELAAWIIASGIETPAAAQRLALI